MDPKDFVKGMTTPGDIAAAAIGYATGFAIDVFFFPGGISPAITAAVCSVGSLGLKKLGEVILARGVSPKISLREKAKRLDAFIKDSLNQQSLDPDDEQELLDLRKVLKDRTALWQAGLLEDDEFEYDLSRWRREIVQSSSLRGLNAPERAQMGR